MGALNSHSSSRPTDQNKDCTPKKAYDKDSRKRPLDTSSSGGWVLPRTRDGCDQIPGVPSGVCESIRTTNASALRTALANLKGVSHEVLALVFQYAALLGDDEGMRVIADKMAEVNAAVPASAFDYARDVTPYAGLGGHTLAAVFARTLYDEQQKKIQQRDAKWDRLTEDPNSDWSLCGTEGRPLCGYIVNNDAQGLRSHLRWLKKNKGADEQRAAMRAALMYAAYLGDDVGIQVLVQEGAEVDDDIIQAAEHRHDTLPGVGGHTFAAMYLRAIKEGELSSYAPLLKLRFDSSPSQ